MRKCDRGARICKMHRISKDKICFSRQSMKKSSKYHNPQRHCTAGRSNRYVASDLWIDATASMESTGLKRETVYRWSIRCRQKPDKSHFVCNLGGRTWVVRSLDGGYDSQRRDVVLITRVRLNRTTGPRERRGSMRSMGGKSLLEAKLHSAWMIA